MTMISYSQNQEDVVLRRAFPDGRPGFYVDVGAHDPVESSVTKHFYDQGWRGVNVEPLSGLHARLVAARPRDVNLNIGLSDHAGELAFFECTDTPSLSTFSADEAAARRAAGHTIHEHAVPVTTLAEICERHVAGAIDFLSVDVEGHERQVLAGGDWDRWRPRVVLVEATRPNTNVPTHDDWEPILLQAGYVFALFDGLNRFYVAKEARVLLPRLAAPANILDDFVPYRFAQEIAHHRDVAEALEKRLAAYQDIGPNALRWARRLKCLAGGVRRLLGRGPS